MLVLSAITEMSFPSGERRRPNSSSCRTAAFSLWFGCVLLGTFLAGCDSSTPAETGTDPQAVDSDSTANSQLDDSETATTDDWVNNRVQAERLLSQGNAAAAIELLRAELISHPDDANTVRMMIAACRATKRYQEGAGYVELALQSAMENQRGSEAVDQLIREGFDLHLVAGQFRQAEKLLQDALVQQPKNVVAHRLSAQYYNSQGRRWESRQHVIELIKAHSVVRNELLSLIDLTGPFALVSYEGYLPRLDVDLFLLGQARMQLFQRTPLEEVLKLVRQARQDVPQSPAAAAFEGYLLANDGQYDALPKWLQGVPAGTDQHPEYWVALGEWLLAEKQYQPAVSAFGKAMLGDPTNRGALRSMIACWDSLDRNEQAEQARKTLAELDRMYRFARDADDQQTEQIAASLFDQVRPWESLGWSVVALQFLAPGQRAAAMQQIEQKQQYVIRWQTGQNASAIASTRLAKTTGLSGQAKLQIDLQPLLAKGNEKTEGSGGTIADESAFPIALKEAARSLGLESQYVCGFPETGKPFSPYQVNGAGIAAFDYDLDGHCDLYLGQSGGRPDRVNDSLPNELFRNLGDQRFIDTKNAANAGDRHFAQGVSVGDLNQDGFPDLLVANIGPNMLYLNQGDGTFREASELLPKGGENWTSTLGLADCDGDQLPDLIEINYIDLADQRVLTRTCTENYLDCQPQDFRKAADRVYRSTATGAFKPWESVCQQMAEQPTLGFGLVVADFDGRAGNDFFVANDGDLNPFWQSSNATGAGFELSESGTLLGCSVGRSGESQACMGVAAGDFDRSGTLDLHVTNFLGEPVALYMQTNGGAFNDEAISMGLAKPSREVLGFGTQAPDLNNDGWLDLVVLNGHVFNAEHEGKPFRMPHQLFQGGPAGFSLLKQHGAEPFFERPSLGRTVAVFDFQNDGDLDLVTNDLHHPVGVLQNESQAGNWIQIRLIGIECERDAIGARVRVTLAGEEHWQWQTAGDGYMCNNEPVLHFGVGNLDEPAQVTIFWPGGQTQQLDGLKLGNRYTVVQSQSPWVESQRE